MQQLTHYIYDNTILVQFDLDPEIKQRNRVVYTRPINIYKGIDNVLKVKIQNSDQKPVNVAATGHTLIFNIVDDYAGANANVVFATNITLVNANAGIGSLTISANNMTQLTREQYTYAIRAISGNLALATYVDDNYGAAGQLRVDSKTYPVYAVVNGNTVPQPNVLDLGSVADNVDSAIFDFGNI